MPPLWCFTPGHCRLKCMVCTMCLVIFAIGAFISLSIPFNTLPYYSYTAEIQFNEAMFTGSVNDFSVEDITALRLGIWAGSYSDSNNVDRKMPWSVWYTIDITMDNSTHTIVTKFDTIFLLCQLIFFGISFLTCFHIYLPKRFTKWCLFEIVIILSSVPAIISNLTLLSHVETEMQKLGETIVTNQGPAVGLILTVDIFVLFGAILHRMLAKRIAKPAKSKDGGGPKISRLTVNPPALNPPALNPPALNPPALKLVQGGPPPGPATVFQQVQPLLPPGSSGVLQQLQPLIPPGAGAIFQQLKTLIPPGTGAILQQLQPPLPSGNPQAPLQQEQGLPPSSFAPAAFQRRQGPPRARGRRRPPNVAPGFRRSAATAPHSSAGNLPPNWRKTSKYLTAAPNNPEGAARDEQTFQEWLEQKREKIPKDEERIKKLSDVRPPPQTFPPVGSVSFQPPAPKRGVLPSIPVASSSRIAQPQPSKLESSLPPQGTVTKPTRQTQAEAEKNRIDGAMYLIEHQRRQQAAMVEADRRRRMRREESESESPPATFPQPTTTNLGGSVSFKPQVISPNIEVTSAIHPTPTGTGSRAAAPTAQPDP